METPGGVGYGYYFSDAALHWTNSTVLDYYIVTPSTAGGDLNYYLYLTSTCRAQLGTEALISYYGQGPAQFWVYDWSMATDRWRVGIELPGQHAEYRLRREHQPELADDLEGRAGGQGGRRLHGPLRHGVGGYRRVGLVDSTRVDLG